jgi:hypothetical protein
LTLIRSFTSVKDFDEGGNKGLFLSPNLGVEGEGWSIVFGSSCAAMEGEVTNISLATSVLVASYVDNENDDNETDMDTDVAPRRQQEGMIDVPTLKTKLCTFVAAPRTPIVQSPHQTRSSRRGWVYRPQPSTGTAARNSTGRSRLTSWRPKRTRSAARKGSRSQHSPKSHGTQ